MVALHLVRLVAREHLAELYQLELTVIMVEMVETVEVTLDKLEALEGAVEEAVVSSLSQQDTYLTVEQYRLLEVKAGLEHQDNMSKWINTKVVFEWNGERYVEKYSEGYIYNGELSLCAEGGPGGGAGGAGGVTRAITRLEVLDPHVVQLMRDVMDSSETAPRLKVSARAAGGGGGGEGDSTTNGAQAGIDGGGGGSAVGPTILKEASGEGGDGGKGQAGGENNGGGGGGGAGGDGGVIVIITTSSSVGTTSVTRGTYGGGNNSWGNAGIGSNGDYGNHGKLFHIRV